MLGREVRMVEEAGEEVRGAPAHAQSLLEHHPQDGGRVPHVDQIDGFARSIDTRKALSIPMKWPTGAPVIMGGPPVGNMWWSCRVSHPIVRWEWMTPFGSGWSPR